MLWVIFKKKYKSTLTIEGN